MANCQRQSKFQLHQELKLFQHQYYIQIDKNFQQLCKLLENQQAIKTNLQKQTKKVLKNSKTIITTNKQESLIKYILQNKTKFFQHKEYSDQSPISKSLIIKQSQPLTRPFMGSCRDKKSFSVQYPRRLSTVQNKMNNSFQDTQIGPWKDEQN